LLEANHKYQMNKLLLAVLISGISAPAISGQKYYRLTGEISGVENSEKLQGATIQSVNSENRTIATSDGRYSILLPDGQNIISISFLGYRNLFDTLYLTNDTLINYKLTINPANIKEVVVTSENRIDRPEKVSTAIIRLSKKEIRQLPSLMGEPDVLRAIQLTPGVQSANEGNAGFNVRGGGVDQNLILLDNAPVYNPSHVLGFFSVFNETIVRDIEFIKSGMPANYGGRMSSMVLVNSLDGNMESYHVSGFTGLISSKVSVEGPLVRDKASFLIAARRSYLDEVFKPIVNSFVKNE
jgi:hypothetical protein